MEEEEELDQRELLIHQKQSRQEKLKWKQRLQKTLTLSMAFLCLGLCSAILGPTLLDLGMMVNKDTEHMTVIFTARSIGFLIGSLVGGVLFDFFDQQILLFYTLAAVAVATAGVPWCSALLTLSALICIQGVAIGVLDTGGNVFCIKIWGKRSGPYMQILHFCFGVGAFLAPLIAQPFLMDVEIPYNTTILDGQLQNLSGDHRLTRDIFSHLFLDNDSMEEVSLNIQHLESRSSPNLFNDTGKGLADFMKELQPHNLYKNSSFKKLGSDILRLKRNASELGDLAETATKGNSSQLLNNQAIKDVNRSSTLTPTTTEARAPKPDIDGKHLDADQADSGYIIPKIKDLKNQPQQNNEVHEKTTTIETINTNHSFSVTQLGLNLTSHGLNLTQDDDSLPDSSNLINFFTPNINNIKSSTTTTTTTTTTSTTTVPSTSSVVSTTPVAVVSSKTAASARETPTQTWPPESDKIIHIVTDDTTGNSSIAKPKTTGDLVAKLASMSRRQFAFLVVAFLLAVNAGLFLFLHCKDRFLKFHPIIRQYRDPTRHHFRKCFVVSIIILLFLFFLAYMGLEVTLGGLLSTFAVYYPVDAWTPSQGAMLTSLFWGCMAIGRGAAIFIAQCLKPSSMMLINLCLTLVGALILSFGIPLHPGLLWVGTVTIGLGMSSLFPTAISWADSHYPLSGRATAVFVAGCGIGEMSIPALTGHLCEKVSYMAIMYVALFLSCLLSLLYVSIQLQVYFRWRSNHRSSHTGSVHVRNIGDQEEESDLGIIEGINLGITDTTWRRRVQVEEDKMELREGNRITEFTKLMEM